MKSPYIDALKDAVAQFTEAHRAISDCLVWSLEDANIRHSYIGRSIHRTADFGTLDRLEYEREIVQEEIMDLEAALGDWQRLSEEIEQRLPQIRRHIDEVATDALTYDEFKSNRAKQNALQMEAFLRDRGLTLDDVETMWKQRLAEPFVIGPVRAATIPSDASGAVFIDRNVL